MKIRCFAADYVQQSFTLPCLVLCFSGLVYASPKRLESLSRPLLILSSSRLRTMMEEPGFDGSDDSPA